MKMKILLLSRRILDTEQYVNKSLEILKCGKIIGVPSYQHTVYTKPPCKDPFVALLTQLPLREYIFTQQPVNNMAVWWAGGAADKQG